MSTNPEVAQHNWRILAYDEHGMVIVNTEIHDKTQEEAEAWCKAHPDYEFWDRYALKVIK